jgi:Fe-S-cluster-containing dehydrogenase component
LGDIIKKYVCYKCGKEYKISPEDKVPSICRVCGGSLENFGEVEATTEAVVENINNTQTTEKTYNLEKDVHGIYKMMKFFFVLTILELICGIILVIIYT